MIATVFMRPRGLVCTREGVYTYRYITDPPRGQDGKRQKYEFVVNAANFDQMLIRDAHRAAALLGSYGSADPKIVDPADDPA